MEAAGATPDPTAPADYWWAHLASPWATWPAPGYLASPLAYPHGWVLRFSSSWLDRLPSWLVASWRFGFPQCGLPEGIYFSTCKWITAMSDTCRYSWVTKKITSEWRISVRIVAATTFHQDAFKFRFVWTPWCTNDSRTWRLSPQWGTVQEWGPFGRFIYDVDTCRSSRWPVGRCKQTWPPFRDRIFRKWCRTKKKKKRTTY